MVQASKKITEKRMYILNNSASKIPIQNINDYHVNRKHHISHDNTGARYRVPIVRTPLVTSRRLSPHRIIHLITHSRVIQLRNHMRGLFHHTSSNYF